MNDIHNDNPTDEEVNDVKRILKRKKNSVNPEISPKDEIMSHQSVDQVSLSSKSRHHSMHSKSQLRKMEQVSTDKH